MPCHQALAEALHAYIAAAGITVDKEGFPVPHQPRPRRHHARRSADDPGRRLAHGAQLRARRRDHGADRQPLAFRATGITAYLANGGALSTRTTKLYDRTKELTQNEVERIML
jgi:hypothetical protein